MSTERDAEIITMQRELIGQRYCGASLASISLGTSGNGIVDWLKKGKSFLLFMGSPGVGKTHFCSALIPWIHGKIHHYRYFTEREFFSRIRSGIDNSQGDYLENVKNMCNYDFFMLDDLGSSGMNDWRREILLDVIDHRYESQRPTVFTTNFNKSEIVDSLGKRSASRLFASENLIIDMHGEKDHRKK